MQLCLEDIKHKVVDIIIRFQTKRDQNYIIDLVKLKHVVGVQQLPRGYTYLWNKYSPENQGFLIAGLFRTWLCLQQFMFVFCITLNHLVVVVVIVGLFYLHRYSTLILPSKLISGVPSPLRLFLWVVDLYDYFNFCHQEQNVCKHSERDQEDLIRFLKIR